MSERFSIGARAQSFVHAFRGIGWMLAHEHNSWIHAFATLSVVALGLFLGVSRIDWCWLVLAIALVWCAEAFNTALEALADATAPGPDPLVGRAKDAAAGAVLLAAIGAAVVGFLVLGPPLVDWLGSVVGGS